MALDPDTKKQLIAARENIKAQLNEDDSTVFDDPADPQTVKGALEDELRQIDEILGIDPDNVDEEAGKDDPEAEAAAAAAAANDQPTMADVNANLLASRVVVDDAATWHLGRVALIAALVAVGIAVSVALVK